MESRLQLRVQRYGWNRAATQYERFWADQLQPAQDALLEAANGCAGQWTEDAVYRSFVVVQALQRFLNLPAIGRRHLGFRRQYTRRRRDCWRCGRR